MVKVFSLFTELDIYLFAQGRHFKLFEKLGSHLVKHEKQNGTYFAVWAPNALRVSVIGNFNQWNKSTHVLNPRWDSSGIWEGFIPNIGKGEVYKYAIITHAGHTIEKGDPFAKFWECPPKTASVVWENNYKWKDQKWIKNRINTNSNQKPCSVYEVHLGSWKKKGNNERLTYTELADTLVKYVLEMGFTHVELMPVMEHPYDPSWGYQITGFFAPSSRFGNPDEFSYLVDAFHQNNIAVILDWVPSHFPGDGHGLFSFDGSHLYEHPDWRKGYHPDWKSYIFNYGRNEVKSFLISNALFWIEQYHADGIRVDAVASLLYLDYSRKDGQWSPNQYGGRENLEAIQFLKELNEVLSNEHADVLSIAEESTAWPGVTRNVQTGGLGFSQKWMMGWMNDTLEYFKRNPIYRSFHQNNITFSLHYAFSENFMLPLSHDEVVHGKQSLLHKMPGDDWQKFANLRLLFSYMFTHPGTKLLFMGSELAPRTEWNHEGELNWNIQLFENHKGVQTLIKDLNQLYKSKKAFWENSFDYTGFEWIDLSDNRNCIIAYLRKGKSKNDTLLVICNFTPNAHSNYKLGVPFSGNWNIIFNSDDKIYWGSNYITKNTFKSSAEKSHNRKDSILLSIPPLATIILECKAFPAKKTEITKTTIQAPKPQPKSKPKQTNKKSIKQKPIK